MIRTAAMVLRVTLAVGLLSAVADRFGLWGPPGTPVVAWGNMTHFLAYVATLNDTTHPIPRKASEEAGAAVGEKGVNVSVVRLPQVHDTVKQGLITPLVQMAREKGLSAYVGNGMNRWPAGHVNDVAQLFRLALEKAEAGSRYHAAAEEGIPMRDIAEVIGRGLKAPVVSLTAEEAPGHFGFMAMFAGLDMPASSSQTQERLGWHPTGPGLISDLEEMRYS